jgi:hypothetical protein
MCWHDCRVHGIGIVDDFNPHQHEIRLDIDYIFEWAGQCGRPGPAGFWIAPATLVFPASAMKIDVDQLGGWWIMLIERSDPKLSCPGGSLQWSWKISLNFGGLITIRSTGFAQYTRREPVFLPCPDQCLDSSQRGGISFDKRLYDQLNGS